MKKVRNKGRNTKKERRASRIEKMLEALIERQEKTDEQIRKTDEQIEKIFKSIEELKLRQEETDKQIRELKIRQEETDEQIRELAKRIRELSEETDRKIRQLSEETDRKIRQLSEETDRKIRQLSEETDRKIRQLGEETDRKIRQLGEETDRKIMKLGEELRKRIGDLTDAQGLFWESVSESGIKKFLEDRGYQIKRILRHVEAKTSRGEEGEFDIIFEAQKNGEVESFIVEVKSTAHAGYINEFIEKLRSIFDFFPEFRGKKIWGVFSSGRYGDGTERYAIKNGLITFGVSGEVVYVLNAPDEIRPFFG